MFIGIGYGIRKMYKKNKSKKAAGACPNCHQSEKIEVTKAPDDSEVCTCAKCGTQWKLEIPNQ